MKEFAIGKCQFYFATIFGIALFLMNFVIIFQGTALTWYELLIVAIFVILYISLIAMVVFERTSPISLMTEKQL